MGRDRIRFVVIYVLKSFISLTIAVILAYPTKLSHVQAGTKVEFGNDSLAIINQICCRMPRANVNLTSKDVTNALNLPDGTILYDQLLSIGICKASAKKLGHIDTVCMCFGYGPIFISFLIAVVCCSVTLYTAISNIAWITVRRHSVTSLEIKAFYRLNFITAFFNTIILFVTAFHFSSLVGNFRYAHPNDFERQYYKVPAVWDLVVVFCSIYYVVCLIENVIWWYTKITYTIVKFQKKVRPSSVVKTSAVQPVQIENCTHQVNNSIDAVQQLLPANQQSLEQVPLIYTPSPSHLQSAVQSCVVPVNQEMKLAPKITTKDVSTQAAFIQTIHLKAMLETSALGQDEKKTGEKSFSI